MNAWSGSGSGLQHAPPQAVYLLYAQRDTGAPPIEVTGGEGVWVGNESGGRDAVLCIGGHVTVAGGYAAVGFEPSNR